MFRFFLSLFSFDLLEFEETNLQRSRNSNTFNITSPHPLTFRSKKNPWPSPQESWGQIEVHCLWRIGLWGTRPRGGIPPTRADFSILSYLQKKKKTLTSPKKIKVCTDVTCSQIWLSIGRRCRPAFRSARLLCWNQWSWNARVASSETFLAIANGASWYRAWNTSWLSTDDLGAVCS